jgi:Arc/MetJ family transcription regulator
MMAARAVTNALLEKDTSRSQAAVKDAMDRVLGKATERREIKHQMANAPDEQLDALIQSRMNELAGEEDDGSSPDELPN